MGMTGNECPLVRDALELIHKTDNIREIDDYIQKLVFLQRNADYRRLTLINKQKES